MKHIISLSVCVFCFLTAQSQDGTFEARLSSDTIYFGNNLEVSFTLKNIQGNDIKVPELIDFDLVSGPNHASSFSMINGEVSQEMTYSCIVNPRNTGEYEIGSASIETENGTLNTEPLTLVVLENPDGVEQPVQQQKPRTPLDWKQPTTPKKKRKTYKI